jgi:hypothetical protein
METLIMLSSKLKTLLLCMKIDMVPQCTTREARRGKGTSKLGEADR